MSATLTWYSSGFGAKTGTTATTFIQDIKTLMDSKAADPNFSWEVCDSNFVSANTRYLNMRPKSGAAGRILIVIWVTAPGVNNPVLLDQSPTIGGSNFYIAFFPNGNTASPSNLTTAGVVMGNDTGAVKVNGSNTDTSFYSASIQPFYFESAEAVWFGAQNPAALACWMFGAGWIVVDDLDDEYPAVVTFGTVSAQSWGTNILPWQTAYQNAGLSTQSALRTTYPTPSLQRCYWAMWNPSSAAWSSSPVGPNDILTDTGTNRVWFVAVQLLGNAKGEGPILKMRQIGFGPGTLGAFTPYQITGPVVVARQFNGATAGGAGYPWLVNFKL